MIRSNYIAASLLFSACISFASCNSGNDNSKVDSIKQGENASKDKTISDDDVFGLI